MRHCLTPRTVCGTPNKVKFIKLLRMFNVRHLYPLLMAGYQKLSSREFTKLLKSSCIISFRYNVNGNLAANEQKKVYNRVEVKISSGKILDVKGILSSLQSLYASDEKFRNAFWTRFYAPCKLEIKESFNINFLPEKTKFRVRGMILRATNTTSNTSCRNPLRRVETIYTTMTIHSFYTDSGI